MTLLARVMAAAVLAAPILAAVSPKLLTRQYQDPNSELVINNPACDFYRCYIFWEPGTQVAVNWINPPQGSVQVDLMTNNNSDVAYNVGTAPAVSNTCDAGSGYGQPGPNGAECGGFVFTVPSSWNAGNYSGLRAMSVENQDLQSFTDMIYITHNSSTKNDVPLSIVSGSTSGNRASSTTASSATSASAAGATTTSSARSTESARSTQSASAASVSASMTSSSARPSSTSSGSTNGALSGCIPGTSVFATVVIFAVGVGALL
ncbi:uncharacterized protein MEPE_00088 [Melanopsichium pennsylvanicum]|uniref:Uncharacterized protein n=2 Tax=Melanopsichium pennsylvanicum TaxID=63383 RepID=A0AAJ4XHP4_9BASI|nr:putative protein [Melanopsichium pennsylvanicum 4]SNX81383.1 uncharacterized protein MEPE_00088 [Melanopsichium pennsylvanicum]